jgi:hypothetical protein
VVLAIIIIGLLLSPVGNQAGGCDDFPFKRLLNGGARYTYRGRYVNEAYEYSVMIPAGLAAYDGRNQANHEGFGMALGGPPQSFIFVRGQHNSAGYETPREAATRMLEWMREDGKQIEAANISESRLGTLNSALLVVSYACPGSPERQRRASVVALGPDKGFLYALELYSPDSRYESDRVVLDELIKSWKMLPEPRRRRQRHN